MFTSLTTTLEAGLLTPDTLIIDGYGLAGPDVAPDAPGTRIGVVFAKLNVLMLLGVETARPEAFTECRLKWLFDRSALVIGKSANVAKSETNPNRHSFLR